ncbi:MAG: glycosyltransferase [Pseudomonadota bacterium]
MLVVGGGTAGHVVPAIPVMQLLLEQGHRLSFVGSRSGLEPALLSDVELTYHGIATGKLRRYWSWQNLMDVFRVGLGTLQALWLLMRDRPHVVFSKGGFVSFPVVFAAWLLRIPVVAHESDLSPGLANRLVLPFLRTLCTSFAETADNIASDKFRVLHTGTPIRPDILHGDAGRGRAQLEINSDKPLLVITGGSLGADVLNDIARAAAAELATTYAVLHVCGAGKTVSLQVPDYQQREYISEGWGDILAAADVVVSRAGANALFELLALGKLNLLVPLPKASSRGDQLENAAFAEAQGYSAVVAQETLNPTGLVEALRTLQGRRAEYQRQLATFECPPAATAIAAEINRFL